MVDILNFKDKECYRFLGENKIFYKGINLGFF